MRHVRNFPPPLPDVRQLRPLVAVPLFLLVVACGGAPQPAGPPAGGMPPAPVEVLTLESRSIERTGEYVGTIRSRRTTTIQPQAEGFLVRILVSSGTRVDAGTPLFEIDAPAERAALAAIESTRVAREADAEFARQQAERAKALLAVGAMSQQEFEQATTAQRTAEAQLRAVSEQIRQQQAQLAYFRVVAPGPGVVGDVPVRVGDRVTRSTVLTTLDDNSALELYVNVPVQEAAGLRTGLPVRILSASGDLLATEAVNFVSASVDDATQTVLVKAPVRSAEQFRTEQTVRAVLVFSEEPGLTIPITSATRINGRYFVFVVEAGDGGATVARQRPVTVDGIVGNDYVVSDGLAPGARLIVGGIQKIGDGAPVAAVPVTQGAS